MVTPEHEALHRIFQKDPELFARAMEKVLGVPVPVPDEVTILNTDLTETRPVERRVDSVLETGSMLAEFTETGLGRTAGRTIWRKLMATASYPYVSQLRAQGQAEGRLEAKREDILQILEYRGIAVSDEVRDAINACRDKKILDRWHRRAITVHDSSELLVPAQGTPSTA